MADVNDRTYDTDLLVRDSKRAPTRSRPNTFGCNLSNLTAVANRVGVDLGVELGVQTSIG